MKQAIIFYKYGEETKSILGYYTEYETDIKHAKELDIHKYQLQYNDNSNTPSISKEVDERWYGDFITDTKIDTLDKVESIQLCNNIIEEVPDAESFEPDIEAGYLYDKLERTRKRLLANDVVEALFNNPNLKAIVNEDNININYLGNEYLLKIWNVKDLE